MGLSTIDTSATYLVTGGAGFVGSNIVHALVSAGARVRVLDDFSTGRRENLDGIENDIELMEGTIADSETAQRAAQGVDFVLHQAALPSVPRSVRDPLASHHACATGTLQMLIAARDAGVTRFVYASSSSVYGDTSHSEKSEGLPMQPLSPYAVAKASGEAYCRAFWRVYGLETVALRYFNVFGPRQDPDSLYSAVVPLFIGHALERSSPTIFGDGEQSRDFTYVSNVVDVNLRACDPGATGVAGEVVNVGCGQGTSVNQLWKAIRDIIGAEVEPRYQPARVGDVRNSLASVAKARSVLGYVPEVSVQEGLHRTVQWFANLRGASTSI